MSVSLKLIAKDRIDDIWQEIEVWIASALDQDKTHTVKDIKQACQLGHISLWVIYIDTKLTGFLTTKISTTPQGNACYAPWLGGNNLHLWVPEGFERLKKILKGQGCLSLSWIGRAAWQKLIKVDYTGCYYLINL